MGKIIKSKKPKLEIIFSDKICFKLGKEPIFLDKSFTNIYSYFTNTLRSLNYRLVTLPINQSIKTNIDNDRMGRISLLRKNELHRGSRIFKIDRRRWMEASVKSRTNTSLSKSKSRVSKMGILE